MKTPGFWYEARPTPLATLLRPLGLAYAAAARLRRSRATPETAAVPVVCIGNLVAGGAGKTPVALAIGDRLEAAGVAFHFLSRGHGGRLRGPIRVDPASHTAADVGDEPLLLARHAPAWIARNRAAGARAAVAAGAKALVLDDGFQNPGLAKDLSLLVVDGETGFGNGLVLPAGPLREPPEDGLPRADAIVLLGRDERGLTSHLARHDLPVLTARVVPEPGSERLHGRPVVAFAGIARPAKFFATLEALGARLVGRFPFADHHPFAPDEVMRLVEHARSRDAALVTTAKDHVRLPPKARSMIEVLHVVVAWDDVSTVDDLLEPIIRPRRLG